jgi:hypothetical protein
VTQTCVLTSVASNSSSFFDLSTRLECPFIFLFSVSFPVLHMKSASAYHLII